MHLDITEKQPCFDWQYDDIDSIIPQTIKAVSPILSVWEMSVTIHHFSNKSHHLIHQ